MKRTIKHPDGREESQEGTPEELAAFDRAAQPPHPLKSLTPEDYAKLPEPKIGNGPWPRHPLPDEKWPATPSWTPSMGTGQPCMFEGLPSGVYHLSCPCPRHNSYC